MCLQFVFVFYCFLAGKHLARQSRQYMEGFEGFFNLMVECVRGFLMVLKTLENYLGVCDLWLTKTLCQASATTRGEL